ncbi:MAG: hypothetical protein V1720_00605 [bacterium]
MKILFFALFHFACILTTVYGQIYVNFQSDEANLDSLLLLGDLNAVQLFFDLHDPLYTTNPNVDLRNQYNKLKENTIKIIDYCRNISENDTVAVRNYTVNIASKKDVFRIEYAGSLANSAYKKSLLYISTNFSEAMKFFQIATLLKNKYLKEVESEIQAKIELIKKEIITAHFKEADELAQSAHDRAKIFPTLSYLCDTLYNIKSQIKSEITEKARVENYWKQQEIVDYTGILFQLSLINKNAIENGTIDFYDRETDVPTNIKIENLPANFTFGFNIGGVIPMYKYLMLGVNYCHSIFTYDNSGSDGKAIFYNFKIKNHSADIYTKLLFRREAGFRPYLTFGLGYLYCLQSQSTGTLILQNDTMTVYKRYNIKQKISDTFRATASFGAEYIPNADSILLFFFNMMLSANFNEIEYVGRANYSLSMGIGVIIF